MRMHVAVWVVLLLPVIGRAKVVSRPIEYKQGDTTFEGYLAYDDAKEGKRPGVLIVHEWWGLNDYAKKRANLLAELGYVALAADMYGKGIIATDVKRAGELAGGLKGKPQELRARARLALDTLKANEHVDPQRVAAIGYCFGGTTVMELAYSGADLSGVVSFHGSVTLPKSDEVGKIKAKMLICTGADDPMIPLKEVDSLSDALKAGKVDYEILIYSDAKHSFTNPNADKVGLDGVGYNAVADRRSWAHMRVFFDELFSRKSAGNP